jgi:hypothetical protein
MRLNLSIVAFALVSLTLTSGCAAKFGEDDVNDPELNPKSGELANVGDVRTPATGEHQIQLVDTNPEQAVGSPTDRVDYRQQFIKGSLGPVAGVPDIKKEMDQDQQLKRSLVTAYAEGASQDDPSDGVQTSTDVNHP